MKDNPYVGPRPYERPDRDNFFGRDREARELCRLICAEREVLFYAQSGAGKTSLLNAKVIPEAEKDGFLVLPLARVGGALPVRIEPGEVRNVFVYSVLLALAGEDADPRALLSYTLRVFLEERLLAERETEDQPTVLILDQFEEIFARAERLDHVEPFFRQVREALDALPELGIVLAMCENRLAEIDPYVTLFARRLRARFRMQRLGIEGALDAIKRPAEKAGIRYEEGVAERLVDDLRQIKIQRPGGGEEAVPGPYVEPVQLQVVCSRLWKSLPEQEDKTIHSEAVARYGDVDRALTEFYESALTGACRIASGDPAGEGSDLAGAGVDPDDPACLPVTEHRLRDWFGGELITPLGTRGLVLRGETETAGLPNAAVDVLVDLHLIRGELRAGARWYELTHDRFIEPVQQSNRAWEERARRKKWRTVLAGLGSAVVVTVILVVLLVCRTKELNTTKIELNTVRTELNTAQTQLETATVLVVTLEALQAPIEPLTQASTTTPILTEPPTQTPTTTSTPTATPIATPSPSPTETATATPSPTVTPTSTLSVSPLPTPSQ